MTSSHTTSSTFTCTNAAYLASKVGADLYQCHRRYGHPTTDQAVRDYIAELEEQLAAGYVAKYEFGFLAAGRRRVVSWSYTATTSGLTGGDDRPGGVYLTADVTGAEWFNYLTRNGSWSSLPEGQQRAFDEKLPFSRTPVNSPTDGDGYWLDDRTYSSGGVVLPRRTFRPY